MSDLTWLFVAFIAVWIGLGLYLFSISTRQKRLERQLGELERAPRDEPD